MTGSQIQESGRCVKGVVITNGTIDGTGYLYEGSGGGWCVQLHRTGNNLCSLEGTNWRFLNEELGDPVPVGDLSKDTDYLVDVPGFGLRNAVYDPRYHSIVYSGGVIPDTWDIYLDTRAKPQFGVNVIKRNKIRHIIGNEQLSVHTKTRLIMEIMEC